MNEQDTIELHRTALLLAEEVDRTNPLKDDSWSIRKLAAAVRILVELREEGAAIIKSLREQLAR